MEKGEGRVTGRRGGGRTKKGESGERGGRRGGGIGGKEGAGWGGRWDEGEEVE